MFCYPWGPGRWPQVPTLVRTTHYPGYHHARHHPAVLLHRCPACCQGVTACSPGFFSLQRGCHTRRSSGFINGKMGKWCLQWWTKQLCLQWWTKQWFLTVKEWGFSENVIILRKCDNSQKFMIILRNSWLFSEIHEYFMIILSFGQDLWIPAVWPKGIKCFRSNPCLPVLAE